MNIPPEFKPFGKIPRLSKECIITEKLDGTNAQLYITEDGELYTGSRNRWITPEDDNYGFAKWAAGNKDALLTLGPGHHYGEWWGNGIQRGYNMKQKVFSMFNTERWKDKELPAGVKLVPVIFSGTFTSAAVGKSMELLKELGSFASDGFFNPEGVIIFHKAGNYLFKKTFENDDSGKGSMGHEVSN